MKKLVIVGLACMACWLSGCIGYVEPSGAVIFEPYPPYPQPVIIYHHDWGWHHYGHGYYHGRGFHR